MHSRGYAKTNSEEHLLRVLLLHVGCGFSMRETVVRAKQAKLAALSAVALFKRLRKAKDWLYRLCCALFEERGFQLKTPLNQRLRLIDSTLVKEPGKTGSLWRIHYSFQWPTLACDYFKLTPTEGNGTGDSLRHFPLGPQDYVLADRGYCQASGVHFAVRNQAYLTVRLNPGGIRLEQPEAGAGLALAEKLQTVQKAGQIGQWNVFIPLEGSAAVQARLCVIRKSQAAIALSQKKLRRKASKQGAALQPETLFYAQYVMVLTTFPEHWPAELILEGYRFRWQIELVFKRFKQIAQLGHLPKYDEESAKAWLYGKMFVALLTEKLIAHACAVSPWGYLSKVTAVSQPMA